MSLAANDDAPGALGIRGGSIDAGGWSVDLNAARIAIYRDGQRRGRALREQLRRPDRDQSRQFRRRHLDLVLGHITGTYNAGGDIRLNSGANINASANAIGSQGSSSGSPIAASVFADAAENVTLRTAARRGA